MDRHGPIHLGEGQAVALIGDNLGGVRWRTSDKAAHRGSATNTGRSDASYGFEGDQQGKNHHQAKNYIPPGLGVIALFHICHG